jgi:FtsZ-interacting cell division protein ZipA
MIGLSTVVIVICAVAVVAGVVLALASRRRPPREHGVESFRRHIDALSPEAREEMKKHARPPEERN